MPPGGPRTKPRALNAALPLARGALLTVYDAEDVPDPGQLRLAAALFARLPARTACLQGRLVIDNAGDSYLARVFALEYAGLFDVLNPAFARCGLPVPLGGTSMHLRTAVVRALHGWDAHNVTEDADLGLRLALAGYTVGDLPSPTFEEAPARLGPWLGQRTRWLKGLVQTSLTHGRRPLDTARSLGGLETLCAVALVPGTVASALAYPVCLVAAAWSFLVLEIPAAPAFLDNLPTGLAITLFGTGLAALVLPALAGCARRGWGPRPVGPVDAGLLPAGQPGRVAGADRAGPRPAALEQDPARPRADLPQRAAGPARAACDTLRHGARAGRRRMRFRLIWISRADRRHRSRRRLARARAPGGR